MFPTRIPKPNCFRPGYRYAKVFVLALCAISYTAIWVYDDGLLSYHLPLQQRQRRQLAYLDSHPAPVVPYGRALIDQNFQSLTLPSHIDSALFRSKAETNAADGTQSKHILGVLETADSRELGAPPDAAACDRVLVFMPLPFGHNGHGSQLNSYLLAVMIATFSDRAMVVLEPSPALNVFKSNSQFGCPPEAWETRVVRTGGAPQKVGWNKDFPSGLSRLIRHPVWLSRRCPVPCQESRGYEDWDALRQANPFDPDLDLASKNATVPRPAEITCRMEGRESNAIVMGGGEARDSFWYHYREQMLARDPAAQPISVPAAEWARRLGARPHEARTFGSLTDSRQIWDYVSALTSRTGILRFQPWIARDVEERVRGIADLPLDAPYDAIHVRRGDKLTSEARRFVIKYWDERRRYDPETGDTPRDYIPFSHYLTQFDGDVECLEGPRLVYVATDDPVEVQKEIDDLPKDAEGLTLHSCHRFRFIFGIPPNEEGTPVGFHLDEGVSKGSCEARYARSIAGISDLMILTKSDIFVGEFNSNWGRLVRSFRMKVNDSAKVMNGARPVVAKEMKIAWAQQKPSPPGW